MYTIPCGSWSEFKEHLLRYAALKRSVRDAFIYRGHQDSDWKLVSTLDRHYFLLSVQERREKSAKLLKEFSRELYGMDGDEVIEDIDRLELIARHHGLPTTVLDWSRLPYVAAYFAFECEECPKSGLAAVWCFDHRHLTESQLEDCLFIENMNLFGNNLRAIQQRGVFLRLPIGIAAETALSTGLWKYTIPHSERTIALSDLDAMLITARTLFQNRDAAARTAVVRESLP